jgi:hypothetical protein
LEEQNRIPNVREPGVDAEVLAEFGPDEPSFVVGVGTRSNDAGSTCFLRKAEVTKESISLVGCTERQHFIWGCPALKWVRSWASDILNKRDASSAMMLTMPGRQKMGVKQQ